MVSGPGYLEKEYALGRISLIPSIEIKDGINYDQVLHLFAVAAGKKPTALMPWTDAYSFTVTEADQFAKAHGFQLLAFTYPSLETDGNVHLGKELFFYRDSQSRDRFIELWRAKETATIAPADYHRGMGELLGYPKAEIDKFIERTKNVRFEDHTLQIREKLRPATLDEISKDTVMGVLYPPRQVVQKPR